MPDSPEKFLSRDDLFLLMKSYENSVALNTTLLEQLKQILTKQNELLESHRNTTNSTDQILKDINQHAELSKEASRTMSHIIEKNMDSIKDFEIKNSLEHKILNDEHKEINDKSTNIKSNIKYIYSGIFSIILSIFGLLYMIIDKFALIVEIAKHLGVQ